MPSSGKKMPTADLSALLEGLLRADVAFIFVSGLAAVIQGAPIRLTSEASPFGFWTSKFSRSWKEPPNLQKINNISPFLKPH